MKKVYVIICVLFLSAFLFTGCTKKDITEYIYTYNGESDLWEAEYKVDCTVSFSEENGKLDGENESDYKLVVTYKGDLTELSSVRHVEISYKSSTDGGELVTDYEDGESISSKKFTLSSSGKNNAIPIENDTITVTINIDGETQTLELNHT